MAVHYLALGFLCYLFLGRWGQLFVMLWPSPNPRVLYSSLKERWQNEFARTFVMTGVGTVVEWGMFIAVIKAIYA